ncbi:uncharacterized protein LOC143032337 isoform X8 [Oratosquilla oratoria]|uniref:uncharacterized protein LOC143032337 isoform X8 n=1 Tax=Oratosquilla oratoria TaxID=337810 RepID=UPI003F772802
MFVTNCPTVHWKSLNMADHVGTKTADRLAFYEEEERRAMSGDDSLGYKVELYVYDLSRGFAKAMSPALLGKQIEGLWHTSVVAYGREYFFGGEGIASCRPGQTVLGDPDRVEALGESQVPYQLFLEYIIGLGESSFKPDSYDLLRHNCNSFSNELSQFLCGSGIPNHILKLPDEFLDTQNTLILEDRRNSLNEKVSRRERKNKKKEKKEKKEKKKKSKSTDECVEDGGKKKKKKSQKYLDSLNDPNSPCHSGTQSGCHSRHNSEGDQTSGDLSGPQTQEQILPNALEEITRSLNALNSTCGSEVENSSSGEIVTSEANDGESHVAVFTDSLSAAIVPEPAEPEVTEEDSHVHWTQSIEENSCDPFEASSPRLSPEPETMSDSAIPEEERSGSPAPEPEPAPRVSPPAPEPEPEVEREPPIVFKEEVNARTEFDGLVGCCADMLSPEEQQHMEELRAYIVEDDGSWALGENFPIFFARIFHDESIPELARSHLLRIMAAAALKDDVILMLHQDRKEHTIMNFANKIESLPPDQQESLALFFCNMFEHLSPSEWLLYISEWTQGGQQISNIRVTTKVAVNALLHPSPKVQEYGTAIMYNLGTKEVKTVVFDDVAPELAMAILQYFNNHPAEELVWRVTTALCRFCYASSEVPMLIKMIGPEPGVFKGMSPRIDTVIEEINVKLSRVRTF